MSIDAPSSKVHSLEVPLLVRGPLCVSQTDPYGYCFVCFSCPCTSKGYAKLLLVIPLLKDELVAECQVQANVVAS